MSSVVKHPVEGKEEEEEQPDTWRSWCMTSPYCREVGSTREETWGWGMEGWRDGGMEGWRDGGMEGWRDGGMEGWRDGGMEGWRDPSITSDIS